MKIFTFLGILCGTLLVLHSTAHAQNGWPKTTTTANGSVIKLYEWQPESFSDNKLKARAAISVLESGKSDPVFGVAWLEATTANNGNQAEVQSIYITDIKLPGDNKDEDLEAMAVALEQQAPSWKLAFSLSELQASLEMEKKQDQLAQQINNTPPKVIYTNTPSILVLIDGTPRFQHNPDWGVDAVVNTPFAIVKNNDGRFYLYGGKHWYTANSVTGSYSLTTNVPANLNKVANAVNEANKTNEAQEKDASTIYNIIVSTEPAELIQTKGEPNFAAVNGTSLLYVSNTDNDIFMDINSQQYYVLISGRWYKSKTLSGNWQYTGADQLPADFAKIPAGSAKDNVLASVAGTEQADEAVKEAQVPQTAKVDRSDTKADITYDGDPEFEVIDGTDMYYAINSPASVIRWRGRYYAVDDGIWFESNYATGPWAVAVVRPYAVALIPPRYPVYYMKYVYIYDYTPDYVWVGYTPGYLNTYIYGPTVVYGTGYYYHPWYRTYYYPRPCTWGYGVRYNPWFGWGLNIGFSTGWFHVNIGFGNYSPWSYWGYGGWWGPRVYRPPYCYTPYHSRGGWYGGGWYGPYAANRGRNIVVNNINYNNNIYRARRNVVTRDNQRFVRPNRTYNARNFADNNRTNNTNRFNRGAINRNRADVRNDLPPGSRGDRNRPFRQVSPGVNNNNSNGVNRNGRSDVYSRNPGNNSSRPSREWRNNSNNTNREGRIGSPQSRQPERRQFDRTDNNNRNESERPQFNRTDNNNRNEPARRWERPQNNGTNAPIRRQFSRPDNNNSNPPARRQIERPQSNNGNTPQRRQFERPQNARPAPQRSYQPQNREPAPPRRNIQRPDVRGNGGSRPQIERRQEISRPPVRQSTHRDDGPRISRSGQSNSGSRPSHSVGGGGRRSQRGH
jgi:hypothetical protein